MLDRIPWPIYALAGLLIIVAGAVVAYIYSAGDGAVIGGGGTVPLELARRSMSRARKLRADADALEFATSERDVMADRFKSGELP